MIRLVLLLFAAGLVAWVGLQIAEKVKRSNVDWTGVAFFAGFVAIAFYLRHVTGMG